MLIAWSKTLNYWKINPNIALSSISLQLKDGPMPICERDSGSLFERLLSVASEPFSAPDVIKVLEGSEC